MADQTLFYWIYFGNEINHSFAESMDRNSRQSLTLNVVNHLYFDLISS